MPTFPFSLLLLLILSFTPLPLTSTATTHHHHNRRTLHQPFIPSGSTPPTQPPSPQPTTPKPQTPTKYPFSSTNTPTNNDPPFFPSVPSLPSPPSPPSPASFASFPANISSLILPHAPSPKPISSKLVAAFLTASAAAVAGISVFLYLRRRTRRNNSSADDDKSNTIISEISNANALRRLSSNVVLPPKERIRRLPPNNNNNSSEFLYLGNIATTTARGGAVGGGGDGDVSLRKLDSPELRPLPPLRQPSLKQNYAVNAGGAEVGSEEEEEFYSPRGSSGGRDESLIATGSALENHDQVRCRTGSSASSSVYSLSNSGSPISNSSPPVSSSTIKSRPKSVTQLADVKSSSPSLSPPSSSSPERGSERSLVSSPGITYNVVPFAGRISPIRKGNNSLSPSLSPPPPSSSPERPVEETHDLLSGIPNVSNHKGSSLFSPERVVEKNHDLLFRMPIVSNQDVESILGTSSANTNQLDHEENPKIPLLSLSSPERDVEKTMSPRIFNVSFLNVGSAVRCSSTAVLDQLGNKKNSRSPSLSSSPRVSNVSNLDVESPVRSRRTSLDQLSNKKSSRSPALSTSPRTSNVSNPNVESPVRSRRTSLDQLSNKKSSRSPSLSSLSSSSPERSTGMSNVSNHNVESPVKSRRTSLDQLSNSKKCSRSPSVLSSLSSSPERSTGMSYVVNPNVEYSARTNRGNMKGLANRNSRSPSVSSLSSSPERHLEKTQDSSSGISHVSNPKAGSPARLGNAIPPALPRPRRHWEIPVSPDSSPLEKTHDSSPRMFNVSNQNLEELAYQKHSRSSSRSSLSSPQRPLEKTQDSSTRISDGPNSSAVSPARINKFTPPPPLPPPPPPLPLSRRHWEAPVSTQSVPPLGLKPPVLIATPTPVTVPTPTIMFPIELPPNSENAEEDEETEKPKLKPLHWDKVRASSDREMVWDQIKSSSFRLNEEMIETLFVVNKPSSNHKEATRRYVLPSPSQENRVLDPKKAQNIAIALRALNVTIEEVCDALSEGNVDALGTELLESLLKMAPTKEEEYRLREYKDDSPFKLGPAEKFLKAVLDIPYAFKRADAMLYMANFESEVDYLKKSFETLEAACEELRNSRMFLKLLEAVLKTGNRMNVGTNRGDAHAFKLDTLLKLVDVKGADGKTTLLHFVVQEIIRSEGARLAALASGDQNPSSSINDDAKCRKLGLQVVSALSSELNNVKKSAAMDSDVLSNDVLKLSKGLSNIAETVRLNEEMGSEENIRKFSELMKRFVKMAEEEICRTQVQGSVALSLVKEITEYFHGNSAKEEAHPFRIFMVVRDFLTILDRVCKEVGMINERTIVSSAHKFPVPVNPMMQPLISGFQGRRQYSFSDDESSSP